MTTSDQHTAKSGAGAPAPTVLAGDVGGTHARFALARRIDARWRVLARRSYRGDELAGVPDGILRFLDEVGGDAAGATTLAAVSIAVAGPVRDGEARLTNRDWRIGEEEIADRIGVRPVRVLNDFEALGHALPFLEDEDLRVLQEGVDVPKGVRVVLGAGTGLGQCLVIPGNRDERVRVHATEGGHATFAPRTREEWALREFLAEHHGHVSWERVLSGAGLFEIYRFLVDTGRFDERAETVEAMAGGDPAAVVSERAVNGSDPACEAALRMFTASYGAFAGDAALSAGATGGVYVAGGIAPRIADLLADERFFLDAFLEKGRMTRWVEAVPVRLVMTDGAALLGAAAAADLPAGA